MSRLLRTYQHVAYKDHWCDYCGMCIQPGAMYQGMVTAIAQNKIITFKYHVYPFCDFPKEPVYEESGLEQAVKNEVKKAA